jgi:DNA helicase HerA-like ATPase
MIGVRIGCTASSPSFRRVPVVLDPGASVRFGELVFVQREQDGRGYVGRIVAAAEVNPEAEAGLLQRTEAFGLKVPARRGENTPGLVRSIEVELLEEVAWAGDDFRLQPTRSLPITGAPVFRPADGLIEATLGFRRANPLHIGFEELSGHPINLSIEAMIRHLTILGRSGTGKSYSTGVIMEECARHRVPVVVVDITGEAEAATRELGGVVLRPGGRGGFTVRLANLTSTEIPELAPNLSPDQLELVIDAFEGLSQDRGVDWELQDLEDRLAAAGQAMGGSMVQVADRARRRLRFSITSKSFLGRGLDWPDLFRRHPVINIFAGGMPKRFAILAVAAVCREFLRLRERDVIPPLTFILDEAHRFVPGGGREATSEVIANFLRIGRHLKIGTIIVSQSPSGIDRELLVLTNSRLIHALDGTDLRAVSGLLGDAPAELVERIATLPAGTAVLCGSQEIVRHTVTVNVRRRRTTHGAPTPDLIQEAASWRTRNGAN